MRLLKTKVSYLLNLCFLISAFLLNFYPFSEVLALDTLNGHNFVSDAVKNVGPAVVRIDTERLVERQQFDPTLLDPLLRDLLGEPGMAPDRERGQGSGVIINKNGLVLTKLDVLDSFRDIKICISYKINNQIVEDYPSNMSSQHHVIPIYETLKGWEEKTKGITKFENLPLNAQNFVKRIQSLVNCNIDIVSTGPEREENIIINEAFS